MTISEKHLQIVPLGWALSAALVGIFLVCALLALLLPGIAVSHQWVGLFTLHDPSVPIAWAEGVGGSIAFGWLAALIFAPVYNRIAGK